MGIEKKIEADIKTDVPIIIPAYEPTIVLCELCQNLSLMTGGAIIVVNDGSSTEYDPIFEKVEEKGCIVIRHAVNCGKGRGIKTAFHYVLNHYPEAIGTVTVDADGQHKPTDIIKVINALRENHDSLILGVRNFDNANIPWKSKLGNKLTKAVSSYLCGVNVSDTQTGLRGIPRGFMQQLINVSGERFEFETNMLIEAKKMNVNIIEVSIETIYDSKDNHKTHFDPINDSIRIYRIFVWIFIKYLISSGSSFVIDIVMFLWFCRITRSNIPLYYVAVSTVFARVISSIYNFIVNYIFVFKSKRNRSVSVVRYFSLVVVIMVASALLTTVGVALFNPSSETIIKVIVDTMLFFVCYKVQQMMVF